ncbi:MAG: group II intron reverse transcriptase/maturase, partial [Erysipelotrichaceae bacterium]|nr:group II intron reverse transcriptase/maturase [Erysipelotrichaceae bacterium]
AVTFTKLNRILIGWINYFKIGSMKEFLNKFGQWLRHKVRVIIIKQWKKPRRIYVNLMKLNEKFGCHMTDEEIYKVANSRLGWYRRSGMYVVNYLLSPAVLAIKKKERPGLVNPLAYYMSKS